jgi:hypothetical protein
MTSREWSDVVWAVLGVAVLTLLVVTWASRGRRPSLGTEITRITSHRWGRIALVLGWAWLGWHAFAR